MKNKKRRKTNKNEQRFFILYCEQWWKNPQMTPDGKKFKIPDDLEVKSQNFLPKLLDAEFLSKKSKRQ